MKVEKQIKNTKTAFLKAYAVLSQRKAADKITVSDLCQEAEFSRNTFYAYYKNIEDFLTKSDVMILEDVMSEIGKYRFDMDFSHSIEFYTYIKENADVIFSVLERPGGPGLSGIYEAEKEYCLAGWSTETQLPPEQLELIFAHHFGGMYSMLRAWWKSGFLVETETFKELLENSGMFGLYHFVYTI